ncbi:MAG: DUF4129 domain-containing protein [Rhizobiaceae bacterium]
MRIIVILIGLFVPVVLFASAPTFGAGFQPPETAQGEIFNKAARSNWQRVDAEYLDKDQPLESSSPSLFDGNASNTLSSKTKKYLSRVFLFALAFLFIVLFLKYIGWNLPKFKNSDPFVSNLGDEQKPILLDENGELSCQELKNIKDPREGLRALLVQALVRAAQQNDVVLRRSLTARDVMQKIPPTWHHHSLLQALVGRSELVLFGGRDINREDYTRALSLAQPLFVGGLNP